MIKIKDYLFKCYHFLKHLQTHLNWAACRGLLYMCAVFAIWAIVFTHWRANPATCFFTIRREIILNVIYFFDSNKHIVLCMNPGERTFQASVKQRFYDKKKEKKKTTSWIESEWYKMMLGGADISYLYIF